MARLRELVGEETVIEVDGGIGVGSIGACARAGASLFVAGSSVFGPEDPAAAFAELSAASGVPPSAGPH